MPTGARHDEAETGPRHRLGLAQDRVETAAADRVRGCVSLRQGGRRRLEKIMLRRSISCLRKSEAFERHEHRMDHAQRIIVPDRARCDGADTAIEQDVSPQQSLNNQQIMAENA